MSVTETCGPCEHAAEHGWWGPGHRGTHCRDCHRSWTGKAQAHCVRCHEHFGSMEPFDIHLEHCTGAPLTARQTLAGVARNDGNPRLALRDQKGGPTWVRWRAEEHPFA